MDNRNYWLNTFKGNAWIELLDRKWPGLPEGWVIDGFPNSRKSTVQKMQPGDYLLCYQAGASSWIGLLKIMEPPEYIDKEPLEDEDRIWPNDNDLEFRNRVKARIVIRLTPETGVPMSELGNRLSIVRDQHSNYWKGFLSDNPRKLPEADGIVIVHALQELQDHMLFTVETDLHALQSEESSTEESYQEGKRSHVLVNKYERNLRLRAAAIKMHGTRCQVCGFSFDEIYGTYGEDFIEVHHLYPVSRYTDEVNLDPSKDMAVLCANCHRMIHRRPESPLSLEELRHIVVSNRVKRAEI